MDQSVQLSRFDDQSHQDKTDQSKPRPEAQIPSLHLTLKMTAAEVSPITITVLLTTLSRTITLDKQNISIFSHYLHLLVCC